MVDGTNIFDHSLRNDSGTYENIEEIVHFIEIGNY